MKTNQKVEIDVNDLYMLIHGYVKSPVGMACVHYVALNLCSVLEKNDPKLGFDPVFKELVESISLNSEGNERSMEILEQLNPSLKG